MFLIDKLWPEKAEKPTPPNPENKVEPTEPPQNETLSAKDEERKKMEREATGKGRIIDIEA